MRKERCYCSTLFGSTLAEPTPLVPVRQRAVRRSIASPTMSPSREAPLTLKAYGKPIKAEERVPIDPACFAAPSAACALRRQRNLRLGGSSACRARTPSTTGRPDPTMAARRALTTRARPRQPTPSSRPWHDARLCIESAQPLVEYDPDGRRSVAA